MTGGSQGKDLAGLANMFNNPSNYNILPYVHNNTIDGSEVRTGFFVPAWKTVMHTMDKRGVVDELAAREYHLKARRKASPTSLPKICAEQCFTAEEALSLGGDNFFNKEKLSDQYLKVVVHKTPDIPKIKRGNLFWVIGPEGQRQGVRFEESKSGQVEIIEEPVSINGIKPKNLYVAGIDSIDKGVEDSAGGGSSFCILVKKRTYGNTGDVYVAKYIDRPNRITDAYEIALKLLVWYDCKANLEDTKIMIREYFKNKGFMSVLMARPQAALNMMNIKKGKNTSKYIGTQASAKMVQYGLGLVSEYVEESAHKIYFKDMLDQLKNYQFEKKTKFDIVAAMQMTEIGDEDMISFKISSPTKSKPKNWKGIGYYIDDDGCKRFGVITE